MKKTIFLCFLMLCIAFCSCSEEAVADEQMDTGEIESNQISEAGDVQSGDNSSEPEDSQGNEGASTIESSTKIEAEDDETKATIMSNAIENDATEDTQIGPDGEAPDEGNCSTECSCNCHCSQYSISMGEAILIAQNHYFATIKIDDSFNVCHVITPICISDSEECWRIKITERCVGRCDEIHLIKGYSHLYVIDKKTGEIIDINPQY